MNHVPVLKHLTWISIFLLGFLSGRSFSYNPQFQTIKDGPSQIYFPLIKISNKSNVFVNAPYLIEKTYATSAIFWFGQVTPEENYADIRIGYNQDSLWVHLEIFDRRLWYEPSPDLDEFQSYDSASLYLDTNPYPSTELGSNVYRFDGMLNWWESREEYQVSYRGSTGRWIPDDISFTTISAWKGNVPNDAFDDRGWIIVFEIPFESLGFSTPPPNTYNWHVAISLHDRDDVSLAPNTAKNWPENIQTSQPDTWGILRFGAPVWTPPVNVIPRDTVIIRHKLNDIKVIDVMAGGGFLCGEGLEYWTEWGQTNYSGTSQVNIQNEFDVSDWPCFSKYYVIFPLDSIPKNKQIISATLILYQTGNAGGGNWGPPGESVIQVLTTKQNWLESSLTWNNAPQAIENVSALQVEPITTAGVPREWNISYALNQAYQAGTDLSLVLYSADGDYNTGRYFYSSDINDYEELYRPTLTVTWGDP